MALPWSSDISFKYFRWEIQGHVDREVWKQAGDAGMLCKNIPAEAGGHGADFFSAVLLWEEQMYCNAIGSSFPLHSDIVAPYIAHLGTKEQKERIIPKMKSGEMIGSIAMTEPSAGSDLQGIKTVAKPDGDDWILNGSKVFISNGYLSDVCIVVAVTNTEVKKIAYGISLFIVERGMKGFTRGRPENKLGQKTIDICQLYFDDVRLPKDAVLGEINKGFYYLMEQLPRERLLVGGIGQAHSEFMFEKTRSFVNDGHASGQPLSNSQVVQHKLAELKTDICFGRSFADQCFRLYNEGRLNSSMSSMVKYWCTDLANRVASECIQLHGETGCMWENDVSRAFIDSRVQSIYGGSNEIMKELIARDIIS
ncbi:long-chain specific acyl-CoA dehydrogenase, mitochondrial-like [Anneissia japonica]|uniref:long-chain specific acyl-CoA dehydrogenase, mitochondrial-like n=1 Tax=Anneissia japonica TaxID=1529436 RepID=UPI0014259ED8|nr:long-chain specific acyl-CoA dehydrogenase, mitochondrial-like [Anneissia japonica]